MHLVRNAIKSYHTIYKLNLRTTLANKYCYRRKETNQKKKKEKLSTLQNLNKLQLYNS